jgi:glycosyltransferase involved in cell wall biosynthesis
MIGKFVGKFAKNDPVSLARKAARVREWDAAVDHYREALVRDSRNTAVWVQYGHALKESGKPRDAEGAYRKALALGPMVADTYLQLGHVLKLQGYKEAAARAYLQALACDPNLHFASVELASLGWRMADINSQAIARFKRSVELEMTGACLSRPEPPEPAGARASIVFDVSDLMRYFCYNRLPTGIQRVQINVVASLLRKPQPDFDITIGCLSPEADFWVTVPETLFLELSELAVAGAESDDPVWRGAVGELHLALLTAPPLNFRRGASLVNIGTSWWHPDSFLVIRRAKAKYGIRYIPFVHDCVPIIMPEYCVKALIKDYTQWLVGVLIHADGYLVNSQSTGKDLDKIATLLHHKIPKPDVIRLDGRFSVNRQDGRREPIGRSIITKHQLHREPFVLFVGTIEPRKNHLLAFNVWLTMIRKRGLRQTPRLVCVGKPGWLTDATMGRLESSELLQRKVLVISKVTDNELAQLYRTCLFTLYPSSYEGWGLPITESLSYGKIPLTTAVSALPEAGGSLAEYFDLRSEHDMLAKLERLIDDVSYRERREVEIKQRFRPRDWIEIAEEIVCRVVDRRDASVPLRSQPTEADEIWPLPARTGRYYALSQNSEIGISAVMEAGELYRMGSGWWSAESWGTWLKQDVADLAFTTPDEGSHTYLMYLGLRGIPGKPVDYHASIVGSGFAEGGTIDPEEDRWIMLPIGSDIAQNVVHVRLTTNGQCDLRTIADGEDGRVVRLGVLGFYLCREDDAFARHRFIEALQLKRLDYLNGRTETATDHLLNSGLPDRRADAAGLAADGR